MLKVLVADDSPAVLRALTLLLEQEELVTVCGTAGDGATAVRQFCALHPALVILDLAMPGLNGLEAARSIHSLDPKVPIVIFTFHPATALEDEVRSAGATRVVSKADAPTALIEFVRDHLRAA